jgi:monoterpene epsilon-lactone hydrolase
VKQLDAVIDDIKNTFASFTPETPLAAVRGAIDKLFIHQTDVECTRERISLGDADAELITAKGVTKEDGAILYIHGGGFVVCSIDSHRGLAERLSQEANAAVLLVGYRLAPEHPFPAALDDSVAGYQWLLDQGYAPSQLAIAGDSAGGGLALTTLHALKQRGLPMPACVAVLSPWVDLELTGESMVSRADLDPLVTTEGLTAWAGCYAPGMDLNNPLLQPLKGDLKGLPPMLIQIGEREALYDDSKSLADAARAAGVDVEWQYFPGQIHDFQMFGHRLDEARKAIKDIGAFIRKRLDAAR